MMKVLLIGVEPDGDLSDHVFRPTEPRVNDEGLRKTPLLALNTGAEVDTIQADIREWAPNRTWDALVTAFLHLPPDDRPQMYALIRECLRRAGSSSPNGFAPNSGPRAAPRAGGNRSIRVAAL